MEVVGNLEVFVEGFYLVDCMLGAGVISFGTWAFLLLVDMGVLGGWKQVLPRHRGLGGSGSLLATASPHPPCFNPFPHLS